MRNYEIVTVTHSTGSLRNLSRPVTETAADRAVDADNFYFERKGLDRYSYAREIV